VGREGTLRRRRLVRPVLRRRADEGHRAAEAYLRWKTELRWDEEEQYSFRSSVRASLRLPRMKKRWRLVFTSESKGDPNAVIPEDPGNPGLNPASQVRTSSTELIYDVFRTTYSVLDAGSGCR